MATTGDDNEDEQFRAALRRAFQNNKPRSVLRPRVPPPQDHDVFTAPYLPDAGWELTVRPRTRVCQACECKEASGNSLLLYSVMWRAHSVDVCTSCRQRVTSTHVVPEHFEDMRWCLCFARDARESVGGLRCDFNLGDLWMWSTTSLPLEPGHRVFVFGVHRGIAFDRFADHLLDEIIGVASRESKHAYFSEISGGELNRAAIRRALTAENNDSVQNRSARYTPLRIQGKDLDEGDEMRTAFHVNDYVHAATGLPTVLCILIGHYVGGHLAVEFAANKHTIDDLTLQTDELRAKIVELDAQREVIKARQREIEDGFRERRLAPLFETMGQTLTKKAALAYTTFTADLARRDERDRAYRELMARVDDADTRAAKRLKLA